MTTRPAPGNEPPAAAPDAPTAPQYQISTRDYLLHGLYLTLYGLPKYFPSPIGDFFRYWTIRLFGARLGRVRVYEGVTIWYPYRVQIGDNVTLNEWIYIDGFGGVRIDDGVRIAHRTTIMSSDHRFDRRDVPIREQGLVCKPVHIERDVWLGCNVTILPGVTLREGAIVAAGAVVTRDVAPFTIVAGVPARPIGVRGAQNATAAAPTESPDVR